MPKFSIVMPCTLADYPNAATNRPSKLKRAIDSCIGQTFKDWELLVIADGCSETFDFVSQYVDQRIDCLLVDKQTTWSPILRNLGIKHSTGEYIVYLDSDDYFTPEHLQVIDRQLNIFDWVWFNDKVINRDKKIVERECNINSRFQYGTANICHKRELGQIWESEQYSYGFDDIAMINNLKRKSQNYGKIETPGYVVCHVPKYKIDL